MGGREEEDSAFNLFFKRGTKKAEMNEGNEEH